MNEHFDAYEFSADMVIEIVEMVEPVDGDDTEMRVPVHLSFTNEKESDGAGERSPAPKGPGVGSSVRP